MKLLHNKFCGCRTLQMRRVQDNPSVRSSGHSAKAPLQRIAHSALHYVKKELVTCNFPGFMRPLFTVRKRMCPCVSFLALQEFLIEGVQHEF